MIIYQATNIVNNISYIGKTIQNFEKYKKYHIRCALNKYDLKYSKNPRLFYKAIRKFKPESFKWEILCKCNTKEELNKMEIYYIKEYKTYSNGYNMTKGGDGGGETNGHYIRTPEIRKKASLSLMGRKRTPESIKKQIKTMSGENHPLYNKGHSKKSIKKMSENSKGIRNSASKKWMITSPNGKVYNLIGGYHPFLKEHNLSRWSMDKVYKGEKDNYKGWKIKKLTIF